MRVGSTATSTKPTSVRRRWYSFSSSAPATHPTHSSMLRRTAGGSSPRTTTSDTANRPPGLSTRNAPRSPRRLPAQRVPTQFEMIASPQQLARSPLSTRSAASPYFPRTVSLMCSPLIGSPVGDQQTRCVGQHRSIAARPSAAPGVLSRLDRLGERRDPVQLLAVERVIDPSPLAPVRDDPRLLEDLEVKREPRLSGVECILQVADAALPVRQQLDDLEPRLIGERVKPTRRARRVGKSRDRHDL